MMNRWILSAARIAAAVAVVVVPFGYAITGNHTDVLMGVGGGIGVGVGIVFRGGSQSRPWIGVLIGSIVGMATALCAGGLSGNRWGLIGPSTMALAVGLVVGLDRYSISSYRDVTRETFILAVLLTLGFFPAHIANGILLDVRASGFFSLYTLILVLPVFLTPWIALPAGLLSSRHEGWHDRFPPLPLILGEVALAALFAFLMITGTLVEGRGHSGFSMVLAIAYYLGVFGVALPVGAFLLGRAAIAWLRPRLRVYGHLIDYLRVMWVPIGGFAVGYLTIIVIFSGFYGMLERFSPGAFSGVGSGAGITDWLSFSFFTALGQDFLTVSPESVGARVLVGVHLILSGGWAIVLFAAVMTSIGPKLERIARRQDHPMTGHRG